MSFQQFWMNDCFIDHSTNKLNLKSGLICILLPVKCPICNTTITAAPGSSTTHGTFHSGYNDEHFLTWQKVYRNRYHIPFGTQVKVKNEDNYAIGIILGQSKEEYGDNTYLLGFMSHQKFNTFNRCGIEPKAFQAQDIRYWDKNTQFRRSLRINVKDIFPCNTN
jgi:hypothetical protein